MSSGQNGSWHGRDDDGTGPEPQRIKQSPNVIQALRDERRESRDFRRRVWRQQRGLCWLMVTIVVLLAVVGLLKAQDGSPSWLGWLWLACLGAEFVCFVLLVRRDDPPLES